MKKKLKLFLRDMLLLGIFLGLLSIVVQKLTRFIKLHKESIIHELDSELLQQSALLQEFCSKMKKSFNGRLDPHDESHLHTLCKKIAELEEVYKKNSNALILLGPIGTISIVLKERQVKADLLRVTQELIFITNRYMTEQKQYKKEIESIDEGISALQGMLL